MKQVTKKEVFHIISEPGDVTRYDYCVGIDGADFVFMPFRSTFSFPQRLNYYEIQDINEEDVIKLAIEKKCNPWTLKECMRTMNELKENYAE